MAFSEKEPLLVDLQPRANSPSDDPQIDLANARNEVDSAQQALSQARLDAARDIQAALRRLGEAKRAYRRARNRTTSGRILSFLSTFFFTVILLIVLIPIFATVAALITVSFDPEPWDQSVSFPPLKQVDPPSTLTRKIPLEAHIMSKCPDARDCLRDLVLPAMIEINPLVNFTLSYIGRPVPGSQDDIECMHGPTECLGNMLELCAMKLYPDPKLYLGFTMCLSKRYEDIPQRQLVQDCALEHGVSFDRLNDCVSDDGGKGLDLLRDSVQRSQDANVTTSCTVRLDDKVWCVRDSGKWSHCPGGTSVEDLVKEIKSLVKEAEDNMDT